MLGLAACAAPGAGPAVDWSLGARLANQIEVETNRDLEPGSQDALVTKAVDAGLVLDAKTKSALFSADLGIAARYHVGADDDFDGEGRADPSLRLSHRYTGKTQTITTQVDLSLSSTDVTQVEDTGTVEVGATQFTGGLSVQLEQVLDDHNRLIGELDLDLIEFDQGLGSLTPSRSLAAITGWEHDLNRTDTIDLTGKFTYFAADNDEDIRNQVLALSAGFTSQRTPRHKIRLALGPALVRSDDKRPGTSADFNVTAIGDVRFDYELAAWQTTLQLSQQVDPSSVGAVQAFTRASGRARYAVNTRESVTGQLSYLRRTPVSGVGSTFQSITFNPSYSLNLIESARLSLDYFFRWNDSSSTGTAFGHKVVLSLTQNFDLID